MTFPKNYRPRDKFILLPIQKRAYDKLIRGLKAFSPEELNQMTFKQKTFITNTSQYAWRIINQLKQRKMNTILSNVLGSVFPELCGGAKDILVAPVTDSHFCVNLKECEVSTEVIVKEFIKFALLPKNFLA